MKLAVGCVVLLCASVAQGQANRPLFCSYPKDRGPCLGEFTRYQYDPYSNLCWQFTYGGCQGNQNNFGTLNQCMQVCGFNQQFFSTNLNQQPFAFSTNPNQLPYAFITNQNQQPFGFTTNQNQLPFGYSTNQVQQPFGYSTNQVQPSGYVSYQNQLPYGSTNQYQQPGYNPNNNRFNNIGYGK